MDPQSMSDVAENLEIEEMEGLVLQRNLSKRCEKYKVDIKYFFRQVFTWTTDSITIVDTDDKEYKFACVAIASG